MFGIGWMEVAILMTLGVFFMTIFLTIYGTVMKQRSPQPTAVQAVQLPRQQTPHGLSPATRLHFFIVFVLFCVLIFGVAIAGPVMQNVILLKVLTISVLAVFFYGTIAAAYLAMTSRSPVSQFLMPNVRAHGDDPVTHVDLVARITQRFCPRCRAALAADAPEGLCPACLMAGGMASAAAIDPANGMAATTPPSGSQGLTAVEWTDLQRHFP